MPKPRNPLELANNIYAVMKRTHKSKQISKKCIFVLNSMVNHAIAEAVKTADMIAKTNGKKTISGRMMKGAIEMVSKRDMVTDEDVDKILSRSEDTAEKMRQLRKVFVKRQNGVEVATMGIRLGRARSVMKKLTCLNVSFDAQVYVTLFFYHLVEDLFDVMKDVMHEKKKRFDVRHIQAGLWHEPLPYMRTLYHGTFLTSRPLVAKKTAEDGTLAPKYSRGFSQVAQRVSKKGKGKGKGKGKKAAYEASGFSDVEDDEGSVFEGFSEDEDDEMDI